MFDSMSGVKFLKSKRPCYKKNIHWWKICKKPPEDIEFIRSKIQSLRKRSFYYLFKAKTIPYQGKILTNQCFFCFIVLPSKKVISGESIFTKARRRTKILRISMKYAVFILIDITYALLIYNLWNYLTNILNSNIWILFQPFSS